MLVVVVVVVLVFGYEPTVGSVKKQKRKEKC